MKHSVVRLLALALACMALLSSCSGGAFTLTYSNGAYRNEKQGVAYRWAPTNYRAVSAKTDETVAVIKSERSADVPLYAIGDMDPALFLTDSTYSIYYSEKTTLPTLAELKPTYVTLSFMTYAFEIGRIENKAEIDDLVEIYSKGTTVPAAKVIPSPESRYELLFFSDTYKGISYALEYWKFAEEVVLYTRLTAEGGIPDTYPGIHATIEEVSGERVAVFHLGSGLVYDRSQDCFYAIGSILESYFTSSAQ